ncbi:MAG: sulfatase-like hydrolase/transferase [Trueperaceae bacterium]|nr:sulfatase-like hydrolase/transferase [Trueperaceae bacterium]
MTKKPNILLITSDQQHFDTLGVTNPKIKTPALDRLCQEGTRFTRAYCPNPVCTPSRSSIITGMYPSQHGAWTIGVKLPEDVPTVGEHLKSGGYKTGLIGKAHFQPLASVEGSESIECQPTLRDLEFWREFTGPWYGFDHIELARNHADESHAGQHYAIWLEEKGLKDWRDYFQPVPGETSAKAPKINEKIGYWVRKDRAWELPEDLHYTTWTGERSLAFIEEAVKEDEPFFLWSSFHDPHPPYTVPEPWASMYDPEDMPIGRVIEGEHDKNPWHFRETQKEKASFGDWHKPFQAHGCSSHLYPEEELKKDMAVYYGMISFMDKEIGRILDKLDELGIADNTIVVFSTDHGHFIGQHGLIAKGPFHYEDMLKLPFIVRWPGQVPANTSSDALQSLVDLAPTFLSASGQKVPGEMQGVNQLGVWQGSEEQARDYILCENRHNPVMPHLRTYVNERYKITVYREADYGELFDLRADPNELNNLWDEPEAQGIKLELLHKFMQASLKTEPTRMPRIAGA